MSDDKSNESKDTKTTTTETNEEKQTNRVYTQSEHDSAMADRDAKIRENEKSMGELKAQLEKLESEKKQKELDEMSELEKYKSMYEDVVSKNKDFESQMGELKKEQLVNEVLQREEFKVLPSVYRRSIIRSENLDEITESANQALEQYKTDFKVVSPSKDIGKPNVQQQEFNPDASNGSVSQTDGVQEIKNRIKNKFKLKGFLPS